MAKYLIAVGGTGMRCLESFVHLCAIGMLDNEEINILIIDTDHDNGNKSRTVDLIENYKKIKSNNNTNGVSLQDSFFSAVINDYKFIPTYKTSMDTFELIKGPSVNVADTDLNQDLANLFFEDETQKFNLEHGYRAQTHLGSYLMYHEIIDEVKRRQDGAAVGGVKVNDLTAFIEKLGGDNNAKIFILGSIFGGTGASSIPIIPRAFRKASQVLNIKLDDIMFGSTLLSEYFTFNSPNNNQINAQKIIAKANSFRLNSQAALMYYDTNNTVKKDYQQFYMIGWPEDSINLTKVKGTVVTGGSKQLNPAHIVELLSAFAAYDFFKSKDAYNEIIHDWQFRSVEKDETTDKLKFDFADLIGGNETKRFKQKLTAFFSMSLMLNNEYAKVDSKKAFLTFYNTINQNRIKGAISSVESEALDSYIKYFAFYYDHKGEKVVSGWLFQVRKSSKSDSFLFDQASFSEEYKDLISIEWADILPGYHFAERTFWQKTTGQNGSFDTFSQKMQKNTNPGFGNIPKANEKLLKWIYDTYSKVLKVT
jgi:hypothetical protein